MAATGYRTIRIQGGAAQFEKKAGEANILPGHLLAISSGNVIKHATADGATSKLVAVENPFANHATDANIAQAYANGDTVYHVHAQPGDVLYMLLATGNNAVEGVSLLFSNGDGTLKVAANSATVLEGSLVGVPAESLNNSSGSAQRLAVRIV